jgi:hypothetical protein
MATREIKKMAEKEQKQIYHVCSVCGHVLDKEKDEEYCPDHPDDMVISIISPRDADKYEQMHK